MDIKLIKNLLNVVGVVGILILVVLLANKKIDITNFAIIVGAIIILFALFYVFKNYLTNLDKKEIVKEELNQDEILLKIRNYLMINKHIQPTKESEELKFLTMNRDINAVYFCEDEWTARNFYILYNLKTKTVSIFNNKLDITKHIDSLLKSQYVVKQRVVDRNIITGGERESEELIDKDELEELKKLKSERDKENSLQ